MASCDHLSEARDVAPKSDTCQECRLLDQKPVALRMCLVCGNVGCCDSTPGRHATGHFEKTGHPVMKSIMPGQSWKWCYLDKKYL